MLCPFVEVVVSHQVVVVTVVVMTDVTPVLVVGWLTVV